MKYNEVKRGLFLKRSPREWFCILNSDLKWDVGFEIEKARIRSGVTQSELASRIGTLQPAISRAERGNTWVSMKFLRKVARALGYVVSVRLIPLKQAIAEELKPYQKSGISYSLTATESDTVTISCTTD